MIIPLIGNDNSEAGSDSVASSSSAAPKLPTIDHEGLHRTPAQTSNHAKRVSNRAEYYPLTQAKYFPKSTQKLSFLKNLHRQVADFVLVGCSHGE